MFHRSHQAFGLVHGFFVFVGGDGIGDDAGSGLDVDGIVFDDGGAKGDAGVVIAVETEVADGSGVGAALAFFHLVDDLHGTNLGRAGDGSGGEGGAHHVVGSEVIAETTVDIGDDVHDVAVALNGHEVTNFDTVKLGDAADIIAGEVDQHDVLGAFFGVVEEVLGEGFIFLFRFTAPARSGNRANVDPAVNATNVDFRRTADEREAVLELKAEHVG